jgi:ABC-2 type transport system permease protein
LFAPLLPSALGVHDTGTAYRTFVPGLLVLLAIFASLYAGLGLIAEVRAGVIERFQVTPVSRVALLLGRCARDVVTTVLQALIITVLAVAFGMRGHLVGVLLAFGMLSLVAMLLSAVSYGLALRLRSEEAMSPLVQTLSQPLMLLSGVMLPLALAPGWMRALADWNPLSYVVSAQRSLFAGDLGASCLWQAALFVGALTVLAVAWAARSFSRGLA